MTGCVIIAGAIILAALIIADAVSPRQRNGYQPRPGVLGTPPPANAPPPPPRG